jgi:protein-S-isoprenylcysteine O-methyltransferase Ste14
VTFPKRYADQVARLRVPSGFLLVATFAWFSHPARNSLLLGGAISILGLVLRAWAAGHLAKDKQLCQSGPYAWSRNPLYIGTLLVACGLVIAGQSIALAIIFAIVFIFIYLPVIELEEQHLRDLFPDFDEYARRVPRLIGFRKRPATAGKSFQARLYVYNREYQALLGFLAGLAFLIIKWMTLQ